MLQQTASQCFAQSGSIYKLRCILMSRITQLNTHTHNKVFVFIWSRAAQMQSDCVSDFKDRLFPPCLCRNQSFKMRVFFGLTNTWCLLGIAQGICCVFISCSRHLRTFPSVGVQRGWDVFSIQMERTLYFAEGETGEDSDMGTKPKYFEGGDWFVSLA